MKKRYRRDPRVEKLADVPVDYSVEVQLGEKVNIQGGTPAESRNESAIYWDMICDLRDGGEIWVDDELLYKDGKFVIEF